MLAGIDEETALVFVSHVLFGSSFIQNLAAITKRAHEFGAMVLADIYESAGTVPVNVRELEPDFATGGSVKWLAVGRARDICMCGAICSRTEAARYPVDGAPAAICIRGRADRL